MEERESWQALKVELASLTAQREGLENTIKDHSLAAEKAEEEAGRRLAEMEEEDGKIKDISERIKALADIPEAGEDKESSRLKKHWKKRTRKSLPFMCPLQRPGNPSPSENG